jgi:hypothetical protein
MAPHFALQCTHKNKNVSAAQQGWVVILPTACVSGGIAVLGDLAEIGHNHLPV